MATRSLTTRTCIPASSALRRRPCPAAPPAARSQSLGGIPSQSGIATQRVPYDVEYARDVLTRAKRQEQVMRRGIKWVSRGVKAVEWARYFCVSVTVATAVMVSKE